MPATTHETELAEPQMAGLLAFLGIDVEFVRAERNTLYFTDAAGVTTPVLDYAGGYGALVLGHNHPEIVGAAREFLDAGRPVLAQASRQSDTSAVASALNRILNREFGTGEPYFAIFANSGAEGIEVAMKHAEFDRVLRVQALSGEISAHLDAAGELVDQALRDKVLAELAEQASRPPVFLALRGSFHGKLAGSVQLSHNPSFRLPFSGMAAQARFVDLGVAGAVTDALAEVAASVSDVVVEGDELRVIRRPFPAVTAFVLEVIQGEGGIHEVPAEIAAELRRACDAADCPIVIDEIQSGMGRTGAFFAASHVGLRPDYVVLAKGLGGGLAKTAVTLIRQGFYRPDFELVHSSTFARDGLSTAIALRTLSVLERDEGEVYRLARHWGERLTALFEELRTEFPDVVVDVRGRGLMLGLEFADQSGSAVDGLRDLATSGMLGYVIAGHLFRAHRIRTFPTASAVNTLRFEPSVYLSDAEVDHLAQALRGVCQILRDQDIARLVTM
ncbi:aminotransferase class III-fold pyridoxal phosphate-dependent enzyme [Dactylosporangium sp. NPDC051485]|uniref:aspartate aminotransferase family protein n=1 Tax=Dactylosporangium sp. NPDC051485 TaxID=3154846 RepID=UPI003449C03D